MVPSAFVRPFEINIEIMKYQEDKFKVKVKIFFPVKHGVRSTFYIFQKYPAAALVLRLCRM
jgi:hypothetical protein